MQAILRAALVIAVFGLVGPPVGGVAAWVMMGARTLRSPLPFIVGSYGEGIELALYTGIVTCMAARITLRDTWQVPILSALLVSLAWVAFGAVTNQARPEIVQAILRTSVVFVPPSTLAAVVCWAFARWLLRLFDSRGRRGDLN